MDLRITPQVLFSQAIASARRNYDKLANLQAQAATGNRLLRPSDDPVDAVRVLSLRAEDLRLDAYRSNVKNVQATLNSSVSALQEAGSILSHARELAIEGSNAVHDAESLESLATEVDALLGRMLNVANTSNGERYLFAGTASGTAPFAVTARDSAGRPLSIAYLGTGERTSTPVGQQQTIDTLYPGSTVFQQRQRGKTVFRGDTGAAPGSATDSATGEATLLVRHTATLYAPGSGVQAGTDSPTGDNILGPAGSHTLTVSDTSGTGAVGTVSLDGGTPVAFTSSDTNLKVTGPRGEVVYVNTTAITPGTQGSVAITANGSLSTDGGASFTPIDFTANQIIPSASGTVTNVDTSNIRRTGSERVSYSGTFDVFQSLMALRDDLRNSGGLTDGQRSAVISGRLAELDRVRTGILEVVGEQSANLQQLEALDNRLANVQLAVRSATTDLEGADLSEIVIGIQSQENLLQLTLASAVRVIDQNLLDFLT